MTHESLMWVVGSLILAGFLQGVSGFGFGLTAGALLPLAMNIREAQAVVTLISVVACMVNFAATARHFEWSRDSLLLIVGSWVGVPLGYSFLASLSPELVRRSLGAALCGMVLFELLVVRRLRLTYPRWLCPAIGVLSGALTGAFNIGGPPLVAYVYSQPWSKERTVAVLSLVFICSGLMRVVMLVESSALTPSVWTPVAWGILPTLAALLYGNRMLGGISQQQLRIGVYGVLLFLGGRYLLVGL